MFAPRVIDIGTNSTSPLSAMMVCDDINRCRTLSSIIISCASTVFLCTWVSLHPDVPDDPYEPWWKIRNYDGILKNRVAMGLLALLAPEVILMEAFGDWVHSCEGLMAVKEDDPESTWTETHANLRYMGGFRIIQADGTSRRLSVNGLIPANARNIPVQEIEDRSKGDFIAKSIVILQTLWFTLQMVIRVSQGLAVTELELTTLGHTIFNIFIYWCWWNKPVNIKFPFNVYPEAIHRRVNGSGHGRESGGACLGLRKLQQMRIRLGTRLSAMMHNGLCNSGSWEGIVMAMGGIILGGTFGAVHCLAWNTHFATGVESQLWKASVTAAPGAGILLEIAMKKIRYLPFFVPLGVAIYASARICLIVLSLLALRDLPRDAYETSTWSIYMPHFA